MSLKGLLDLISSQAYQAASEIVAPSGSYVPLIAGLPPLALTVILTPSGRGTEELARNLSCWTRGVEVFPDWEILSHERLSPRTDTMARRIWALRRLTHPEAFGTEGTNLEVGESIEHNHIKLLMVPVRATLAPVNTKILSYPLFKAWAGKAYGRDEMSRDLAALGYERTELVVTRGRYSLRGGIVDMFSVVSPYPVRIEPFGDEIDSIRPFAVSDQCAFDQELQSVATPARREFLLDETARVHAVSLVTQLPQAAETLDLAAQGICSEGLESLGALLGAEMKPLFELLSFGARLVATDLPRLGAHAVELVETIVEFLAAFWSATADESKIPLEINTASFLDLDALRVSEAETGMKTLRISPFATHKSATTSGAETVPLPTTGAIGIISTIRERVREHWIVVIATTSSGMVQRPHTLSTENDIPAQVSADLDAEPERGGKTWVTVAPTTEGFALAEAKLLVISEAEALGERQARHHEQKIRLPTRRRKTIDPLSLSPGEHVVHAQRGIGRSVELEKRTIGKGNKTTSREYVVLEYALS